MSDAHEQFGSDSFLDVVCNMVGILIILVIGVGLKAHHSPELFESGETRGRGRLDALAAQSQALDGEVARIDREIRWVELESQARASERAAIAVTAAAVKRALDERRAQLDAGQRAAFDLQQQLDAASRRLAQLKAELEAPAESRRATVQVVSYPTPIGKTVFEDEHHFQLRGGRVAYIPLESLLGRLKRDVQANGPKIASQGEITDSVGPVDGFRLRYTFERVDASIDSQITSGRMSGYARLVEWSLIPVSSDLGETVDEALAAGSRFTADVGGLDPKRATITVWVYPDSFRDFRRIKEALHKMGFATAGRPLPEGMPISGSPEGSRSSAQ